MNNTQYETFDLNVLNVEKKSAIFLVSGEDSNVEFLDVEN